MRCALLTFSIFFLSIANAHAECEGYNNAMSALEAVISGSQGGSVTHYDNEYMSGKEKYRKAVRRYVATPPIDDINKAVGDLERAIAADYSRRQNKQSPVM